MELVYLEGGTVAALKLGETADGHPVVVTLGEPSVLEPLPLVDGQTEAHGVSYDLTSTHVKAADLPKKVDPETDRSWG